jgi:predicted Zn finger-like uncharacterized protein
MPETITCPQCSRELRVPESLLGKKVKCPGCGTTFTAPAAGAALPDEGLAAPSAPSPGGEAPPAPPPPGGRPKEIDLIANFALFGGIWGCVLPFLCCGATLAALFIPKEKNFGSLCCWPFEIYTLVVGVLSIMTGLKLRRPDAHVQAPPVLNAILRIVTILGCDVVNAALGGLTLYWLKSKPEVKAYFQGGAAPAPEPPPEG